MILTYYTATTMIIIAYLLGSIPSAVWIGKKYYGIDIREYGSKNAGTTNMLRVLGRRAALPVFGLDFLKGFVAVTLSGQAPESIAKGEQGSMTLIPAAVLLGLLLVMGTCTPAPVVNMLNAATSIVLDKNTATAQVQPALRDMVRAASHDTADAAEADDAKQTSSRQEI